MNHKARTINASIVVILGVFLFVVPIMAASSISDAEQNVLVGIDNEKGVISAKDVEKGYVEGEVLVKFKSDIIDLNRGQGLKDLDTFSKNRDLVSGQKIEQQNVALLKSEQEMTTTGMLEKLKKDPLIEYAEPNYIRHYASIPNDTSFSKLWGLHNTGQTVNGTAGTSDADIDAPKAWDISTGAGSVTVAVIDTGIATNHPDLYANIVAGYDFLDDDSIPEDTDGHGTHVAGIIGAVTNNSRGVTGVARKIKIMPLKAGDNSGFTSANFIDALDYAVDKGVKIVNYSVGGGASSILELLAIFDAKDAGVLIIAAAGNDGVDNDGTPYYPADYDSDNIISVAATDQDDNLADWSNYGSTSVDVAAPGVNIYSTVPYNAFSETFEDATVPGFTGTAFTPSGTNNYWETNGTANIVAWGNHSQFPYEDDANGILTSSAINTSSQSSVVLGYIYAIESEDSYSCEYDYISVEIYNGSSWHEVARHCGSIPPTENYVDISSYKNSGMKIRFKWVTDDILSDYGGAYIDNVKIFYPRASNGSYGYMQGTSMAAPYVAGLAALIKLQNSNYTSEDIKTNIITNVDKKDSLKGKVLSGGRINAYKSLFDIDIIPPTATISYSTTKPTNKNVTVTLVPSETVTVTNNGGKTTYTFSKNGSFVFEFEDASGNIGSSKATVENIDKVVPEDPTEYFVYSDDSQTKYLLPDEINNDSTPYFEWGGASDSGSGPKGYYVKLSTDINTDPLKGVFQSSSHFSVPSLKKDGTYYLHIKTKDIAGNISTGVYLTYKYAIPKVLGEEIGSPFIVTGTKAGGGPEVRVLNTSGELLKSFNAYDDTFRGGINVAVGDIDGNGTQEIITSTRTGGIPTIRVFDVEGNNLGWDFDAYASGFRGGINIAVGDIEGDGPNEIAVAPMGGGAPQVRIFGLRDDAIIPTTESFYAYAESFRGGIAISIGDIENDGIGDIVTTPTSNGGPHIRIFGVRDHRYVPVTLGTMAYDPGFRGGINSCVGDVNNDLKDEIMTGIVSAGGPHIRIFGVGRSRTFELQSPGFMAYDPASRGGVSVTSVDVNDDGYDEIITGVGGDGSPLIRIYDAQGQQVLPEFMAYDGAYKSGITLAAGYF